MSNRPSSSHPIVDPMIADLTQIRIEFDIKQKELANRIEVGQSVMSAYENGTCSPQLHTMRAWTEALGHDLVLAIHTGVVPPKLVEATTGVPLTRYQMALAAGILLSVARSGDGMTSSELEQIANILVLSLS